MTLSQELSSLWWPFAVMVLDWAAVAAGWKKLECVAKPGALLALLVWLWAASQGAGIWPLPLAWFAIGLICCLAGDVLLLLPERFFLGGLVAFLLGHLAYIIGLNTAGVLLPVEGLLIIPMALVGGWLFWKVSRALTAHARDSLRAPVALYTVIISLMVASAVTTLFRSVWPAFAAALISLGAILFFTSDAVLAWNRFVKPVPHGKLLVIVAYHLGQLAIIAGAAGAFHGLP